MQLLLLLLCSVVSEALIGGVNDVVIVSHGRTLTPDSSVALLDTGRRQATLMRSEVAIDPALWAHQHKKINRSTPCEWKKGKGVGGNLPLVPAGRAMNYNDCERIVREKFPTCNGCTVDKGGSGRCWGVLDGTSSDESADTETCLFKNWLHPSGTWSIPFVPVENWEPRAGKINLAQWPPNFCIDMTLRIPEMTTPEAYRVIALIGGAVNTSCGDFYIFINDANEIGMGVQCDGGASDPPLMHPEGMQTYTRHDFRFCYDTLHWHARIWDNSILKADAIKRWNFPRQGEVSLFAGTHDEVHWDNSLVTTDLAKLFRMEMWTNTTTTTTTTTTITTGNDTIVMLLFTTTTSTTTSGPTTTTTTITRPNIDFHKKDIGFQNVTINVTRIIRTVTRTITDDIINTSIVTKEIGKQNGTWYLTQRACWAFPCGLSYVALPQPYHCRNWTCTPQDFDVCCALRDTCINYDCGYGARSREHKESILCEDTQCSIRDRETCCHVYASCALKFICPHGYKLKEWDAWPPPACGDVQCDPVRDMVNCCEKLPSKKIPKNIAKIAEEYGINTSNETEQEFEEQVKQAQAMGYKASAFEHHCKIWLISIMFVFVADLH